VFDYKAWIRSAEAFTNNVTRLGIHFTQVEAEVAIEPPLAEPDLAQLQESIEQYLPAELRRFWLTGSRHCNCRYVCRNAQGDMLRRVAQVSVGDQNLYGGASFVNALELPDHIFSCHDWAEDTWIADFPEQQQIWRNALPIIFIENGDYLGLDLSKPQDDPPVVYLSHDDEESGVIAVSFTFFLQTWARLCYIGPELWMLAPFRDEGGLLNADAPKAGLLREVLGQSEN
jgi:hypothetical protein